MQRGKSQRGKSYHADKRGCRLENREQWDAVYELPALRDELMVFPA